MTIEVSLNNDDTYEIGTVFDYIVANSAVFAPPGSSSQESGSNSATYTNGYATYTLTGNDFTYNSSGILSSGVITGIFTNDTYPYSYYGEAPSSTSFTGLSLSVADMQLLQPTDDPQAAVLSAGANIVDNSYSATAYGGNNVISVADNQCSTDITAGSGVNVAVLEGAFRGDATFGYSYDDEEQASITPGAYGNLNYVYFSGIDKIQFLDGSIYESSALPDAQTALMFLGVFGRLPDAINAGGYAGYAYDNGQVAAGNAMLATSEGSADTAGLTNTAFVTRLYNNILDRTPDAPGLAGYVNGLDAGTMTRAAVLLDIASSPEAQAVNATSFDSGNFFAADPNAVEIERGYTTLLGRLPEESALTGNLAAFQNGMTLQDFYTDLQQSSEFQADAAANGGNVDGITAASSYADVFAALHTSAVTSYVGGLVTSTGGVAHLAG